MANETQDRVRMRLDILEGIIDDLNTDPELEEIFGYPAINSLVIIAENNDLRIEAEKSELKDEQVEKFMAILDRVIKKNSSK